MNLLQHFQIYLRSKPDPSPLLMNQYKKKYEGRSVEQAVFNCDMHRLDAEIFAARRTLDIQRNGSKV